MRTYSFPGTFSDAEGTEAIEWTVVPAEHHGTPSYQVRTVLRGVPLGRDVDRLEAPDGQYLDDYDATAVLPCHVDTSDGTRPLDVRLTYRSRSAPATEELTLACDVDGLRCSGHGEGLFEAVPRLADALPPGTLLRACSTCSLADYHVGPGLRCHRDHPDRSGTPTEWVPEYYLCPRYERRPGKATRLQDV